MSFFTRTKTSDPPQPTARDTGKKIILNFGGRAAKAVQEMAAATLQAGGFDAAEAPPQIGDMMPDGTIYAGISPDTHEPIYVMPDDAPLTMAFNDARKYAMKLDAYGHKDWRVPTKNELNVLFNNRAALGGFNVTGSHPGGWYWSASDYRGWNAWTQRFSDGFRDGNYKDVHSAVRCVR